MRMLQRWTRTYGSLVPFLSFATRSSALTTLTLNQAAGSSPSNGFLGPLAALASWAGVKADASFDFICRRFLLLTLIPRPRRGVAVSAGVSWSASDEVVAEGGGTVAVDEEEERVRGLNVDAASLSGLEANRLIWFPLLLELRGG